LPKARVKVPPLWGKVLGFGPIVGSFLKTGDLFKGKRGKKPRSSNLKESGHVLERRVEFREMI